MLNFSFLLVIKGNKIKQEPGEMETLREKEGPISSLDSEVEQTPFQRVMLTDRIGTLILGLTESSINVLVCKTRRYHLFSVFIEEIEL